MKLENTLENKAKFFAQYFSQHVLYFSSDFLRKIDNLTLDSIENDDFLELKPLSHISDEDAIEFFDILFANVGTHKDKPKDFKIEFGKEWSQVPFSERYGLIPKGFLNGIDYLRSKGYALPYMDLSVEDLIDYGWVKLKEN